jgi:hypothetical protein
MAKLTKEARSSLQSARAKNRKAVTVMGVAAAEHGITVPKHIVAKMTAVDEWFNAQLASKAAKAETAETAEAEAVAA